MSFDFLSSKNWNTHIHLAEGTGADAISDCLLLCTPQHNQRLTSGLLNFYKCLRHCCMHVTHLAGLHHPLELGTSGELWISWEAAPVLPTTSNTLLKDWYGEEGEIFFSPVIVDNVPRPDAFGAEVQEKVRGFHTVLLLPAGIKMLYTEERTYTCKHLTTTSGFPVCLLFWFDFWFYLCFFFIKRPFSPLSPEGKDRNRVC